VVAVIVMTFAVLIAAGLAEPQIDTLPPEDLAVSTAPSAGAPDPSASVDPLRSRFWRGYTVPGWVDTLVGAICAVALFAVLAIAVWQVWKVAMQPRGRPVSVDEGDPARPLPADRVADAVDAALEGLGDLDVDPRRAVIACWLRLEAVAAEAGTTRRISDTPTDLVLRLLAGHQVSRAPLEELAEVYRAARYGTDPVDEAMRATAIGALSRIRTDLAGVMT